MHSVLCYSHLEREKKRERERSLYTCVAEGENSKRIVCIDRNNLLHSIDPGCVRESQPSVYIPTRLGKNHSAKANTPAT